MNLYSYARQRCFARPESRKEFLDVLAKRLLKSVARSTGTRIHRNKWVRLVDMIAVTYPGDESVTVLQELSNCIQSFQATHPKTVTRLILLLSIVKTHRIQQENLPVSFFNANTDAFVLSNDMEWLKSLALKYNYVLAGCNHWTHQGQLWTINGTEETIAATSTCCSDCALDNAEYQNNYQVTNNNTLIPRTYAVQYHTYQNNILWGDRRQTNLTFDERRQIWHDQQWSPYSNLIGSYHSSKQRGFNIIDSPWFRSHRRAFGCELEVQVTRGDKDKLCGGVHDLLNPSGVLGEYCYFERDGSIGEGFEIVTQPAGLDVHRAKFDAFLNNDEAKKGLRSHEGGSCGLHVHVGKQYVTQSQIYRIQSFLNDVRNEALIRAIARRYASGYSKFKPEMAKFTAHNKTTGDRYEALNVTGSETIEFRIFRGSLRYESVIAAIEFVNAVLTFCTPGVTSIMDFNAIGFKKFIMTPEMKPDTKFLRSYLSLDANTDNERKAA